MMKLNSDRQIVRVITAIKAPCHQEVVMSVIGPSLFLSLTDLPISLGV